MKPISQESYERANLLYAYATSGTSLTEACKLEGLNVGNMYKLLTKLGYSWLMQNKPAKKVRRNSKQYHEELAPIARYFLDSVELHLKPEYVHEREQLGIGLVAIVEKPSHIIGYVTFKQALKMSKKAIRYTGASRKDVLKLLEKIQDRLVKGEVLLADIGQENTREVQAKIEALGLKACRIIGWANGQENKPWIESLWGSFQERWLRPFWKELEVLTLDQKETMVSSMFEDFLSSNEYQYELAKRLELAPIEVLQN